MHGMILYDTFLRTFQFHSFSLLLLFWCRYPRHDWGFQAKKTVDAALHAVRGQAHSFYHLLPPYSDGSSGGGFGSGNRQHTRLYTQNGLKMCGLVATFLERLDRLLAVRWAKCMERQRCCRLETGEVSVCPVFTLPRSHLTLTGFASSWGAAKHSTNPDLSTVAMDIWQMLLSDKNESAVTAQIVRWICSWCAANVSSGTCSRTYGETIGRWNLLNCLTWRTCCLATMRMSSTRTALHQDARLFSEISIIWSPFSGLRCKGPQSRQVHQTATCGSNRPGHISIPFDWLVGPKSEGVRVSVIVSFSWRFCLKRPGVYEGSRLSVDCSLAAR